MNDQPRGLYKVAAFFSTRSNRKLYVFGLCLLVSSTMWLLLALSKSYTIPLSYPVEYANLPADKVLVNKLPTELDFRINASGFSLLAQKYLSSRKPIQLDIGSFRTTRSGKVSKAYLLTRNLIPGLGGEQFPRDTRIMSISPDSLHLMLSEKGSKQVKVRPVYDLHFKKQFKIDGEPLIQPALVKVSGPVSIIDTLSFIATDTIRGEDIDSEFSLMADFAADFTSGFFEMVPEKVMVTVPVDAFTEGTTRIPLKITNVPEGSVAKTFPDSIEVRYQVAMKRFGKINSSMFKAVVELPDSSEFKHKNRLRVQLLDQPESVSNVRLNPDRVEFIVRK